MTRGPKTEWAQVMLSEDLTAVLGRTKDFDWIDGEDWIPLGAKWSGEPGQMQGRIALLEEGGTTCPPSIAMV